MQSNETTNPEKVKSTFTSRKLRILIAVALIVLTVQAWTGDVVNIFFVPANGTTQPSFSIGEYISTLRSIVPWKIIFLFEISII